MKQIALVLIVLTLLGSISFADDCGGSIPCGCNDTVFSDYTFTSDIGPCITDDWGLKLVSDDITVDCNGYSIKGGNHTGVGSRPGFLILSADNITIKNFSTGIEFGGTHNNTIENNTIKLAFREGIFFEYSENNNILNNTIQNTSTGFRLSTDTPNNKFINNFFI